MDREAVDEIKRAFDAVMKDVRDDIRALAEGQAQLRAELRGEFGALRGEFGAFRVEVRKEFEETRGMVRLLSENSSGASSTAKPGPPDRSSRPAR
jgi:hypothetical protein